MGLAPLQPGDPRLAGPYALRARLGSGGMGQVFLADGPRGERVAVKLLHPHIASDQAARARLARELRTLSRVRGPHLAEVVDADVDATRPFIVTRYVPGPTLEERVDAEGPLDDEALVALARGLATALAAVHATGVVHRDLKPGNVVCGREGPTLLDFGIASAVDEAVLTSTGEVWGTPAYLAPEQVVTGHAEPASDVHALGATLVHAATGRPLFGTGRADVVLYRVVHDDPALPELPGPLAALLPRMLDRDPARRPSAVAVLDALRDPAAPPERTSVLSTLVPAATRAATRPQTRALTRQVTRPVPPATAGAGAPAAGAAADPWAAGRAGPVGPPPARDPWAPPRHVPGQGRGAVPTGPPPRRPEPHAAADPFAGPVEPGPARPGRATLTAGVWTGRLVGLLAVLALAAGALVAPLAVPLVAYALVLPVHDALGRTHAATTERRLRRGPRATDGLRSTVGFAGHVVRACLGAALRLPLVVVPGVAAAAAGFLAALAAGTDGSTALRWSSAALTAALARWLLSPRRHRQAAAARADLRRRAGLAGAAGAAVLFAVTAWAALLAATGTGAEPEWFPLPEAPTLPAWLASLQALP